MLDPITTTGTGSGEASKSEQSKKKLAEDLDQFMNLLVTQLKNQDPLDPMDPNEFTSQLVQFASVEQQIQQNANLERMVELQQTSLLGTVVGYIGSTLEARGNTMPLENGKAEAGYTLLGRAESTTITVENDAGQVVYFTDGETESGSHTFQWNGTDNFGFPVPDGTYKVTVSATDAEGDPIDVEQTVTGIVTGVSMDNGEAILSMGDAEFTVDDIVAIRKPLDEGGGG